jgi:HEAT repeat protein
VARHTTAAKGTTTVEVRRAREAGDLDFLIDCLATGDRIARVSAAGALGDLRVRRSVDALLRCTQAHDWFLRGTATTALGKIGDTAATERIAEIGNEDESLFVRMSASEALFALNDARALSVLIGVATGEPRKSRHWADRAAERGARQTALKRLVDLGVEEAVPSLRATARRGRLSDRIRTRVAIWRLSR